MKEYLFDAKMFAAIRIKANSVEEARAELRRIYDVATAQAIDPNDANCHPFEVSLDDPYPDVIEIDGEAVLG